jgi:hypothetical protein
VQLSEYISRHHIKGEQIADLFKKHAGRYEGSLGRITDARERLVGKKLPPLPEVIAKQQNGEAFRVDLAQTYTSVMQLVNDLAHPEPRLKRPKTATSDRAEATASRIEKFINPAMTRLMSHRDTTELLLVEAEGAALVVPEAARWRKVAGSYYEDDGTTIKPAFRHRTDGVAYEDHLDEAEDDEDRERRAAEFTPDEKRSRAAYDRHVKHLRARHFPVDVELLSRQQYVPINPRIKGHDVEVDGIITKTRLSASEALKRQYVIPGLHDHLEPTNETEGDMESGDLWLYLAVMADMDADGELYPYFAYSLAGKPTSNQRDGFSADAVIDLREQCGLTTLPVVCQYGWRWFTVNADMRSMPYTFPFGRSWDALNAFLTGKAYAGWAQGMLSWFMEYPDGVKDLAQQQAWLEFVKTNPLTVEPFKILPVWGSMKPAIHPGTNGDITEMVQALQGSISSELVSPLARGGGDAGSAIERAVVKQDTHAGVNDIPTSAMAMRRRVGEIVLEVCCGIARKHNKDVLIYGNPDTPNDLADDRSITRAIIELKPHWLGPEGEESYDLVAFSPKSLGDNLAEKAQLFGFWKEGAITDEQWCDAIGVEDPDRYVAQLIFDRWKKGDQGTAVMMKDAAKYLGDQELIAMFEAQSAGAAGPAGQPMGMVAGMNPPMGPIGGGVSDPGAQVMTQTYDPAQSQYAAIAGAARNADAATVTQNPMLANGTGM